MAYRPGRAWPLVDTRHGACRCAARCWAGKGRGAHGMPLVDTVLHSSAGRGLWWTHALLRVCTYVCIVQCVHTYDVGRVSRRAHRACLPVVSASRASPAMSVLPALHYMGRIAANGTTV